jgi:hypothetical protein
MALSTGPSGMLSVATSNGVPFSVSLAGWPSAILEDIYFGASTYMGKTSWRVRYDNVVCDLL